MCQEDAWSIGRKLPPDSSEMYPNRQFLFGETSHEYPIADQSSIRIGVL